MTDTIASQAVAAEAPAPAPVRRGNALVRIVRGQPQAMLGLGVLVLTVALALLTPYIAPYDAHTKVGAVYEAPSSSHWLGLDDGGVDMVTLLLWGSRVSLLVGVAATVVAMVVGGGIGLIAGYFGGKTDITLMRVTDYFLVIPDIPLMIAAAAIWGRSLLNIILIIGLIYWTSTARLIRAQVKSVRERVYVKRARTLGASNTRLLFKHVLPQVTPLLVANTVLMMAFAIFAETAIAFLGLGDPTAISWGRLIENAFEGNAVILGAWWAVVPPGVCVAVVVLACTMLGQGIEDALNPRLKAGHLSVRRFRMRPLPGRWVNE